MLKTLADKNLSQKQAAKIAGVRPSVVNGWVAGVSPQNFEAVKKLADEIDVSFTWLLTGELEKRTEIPSVAELFDEQTYFDGLARIRIDRLIPKGKK